MVDVSLASFGSYVNLSLYPGGEEGGETKSKTKEERDSPKERDDKTDEVGFLSSKSL